MVMLLLVSSFLSADAIVGTWTMDKAKVKALTKHHSQDEMVQFIIGMMVATMEDIVFIKDGSCQMTTKNRKKCWKKASGRSYILYEEDGSNKGAKVELLGDKRMKLIINQPKLKITFNRVKSSSMVAPKAVMNKNRLYHAKAIEMKDFHLKGSGYFIFTGENEYYHLASEKLTSLSLKELQEIKVKDERHEGGFLIKQGAYQVNKGKYRVKNNAFYTDFDPFTEAFNKKKIEVVDENHIIFNGYDYYLEE